MERGRGGREGGGGRQAGRKGGADGRGRQAGREGARAKPSNQLVYNKTELDMRNAREFDVQGCHMDNNNRDLRRNEMQRDNNGYVNCSWSLNTAQGVMCGEENGQLGVGQDWVCLMLRRSMAERKMRFVGHIVRKIA